MGRDYPSRPVVAVGALVLNGDAVLLVRRGRKPQMGRWSVPGGSLELGESIEAGVVREVREETGLDVEVKGLVEVFERIMPDASGDIEYHYVVLDYLCDFVGGKIAAGDDAVEAVWVDRHELSGRALTPGLLPVIDKAFLQRSETERNTR